jgi:hypothetical protein
MSRQSQNELRERFTAILRNTPPLMRVLSVARQLNLPDWLRWASPPAQTPMILCNAALVGAYWERLLVLPLEQRRVAGREPPSEQRSEGQPG